jgi:hypothetical protein
MWNETFWGKRLGHGPFSTGLGFQWPPAPWRWLFYNPRPTEKTKALQANWRQLKSQWRPFQTFFCYYGRNTHGITHDKQDYSQACIS